MQVINKLIILIMSEIKARMINLHVIKQMQYSLHQIAV